MKQQLEAIRKAALDAISDAGKAEVVLYQNIFQHFLRQNNVSNTNLNT